MKGNKIQIQYKDELEVKIIKSSLLLYMIIDRCKLPTDTTGTLVAQNKTKKIFHYCR